MIIMSCHGFLKEKTITVILKYHRKLVSYHLPKDFFTIEYNAYALRDVPKRVNNQIKTEDLHHNDYVMACNIVVPYTYKP